MSSSCLTDTVPEDFEIGPQNVLSSFKPLTEAAICKLIKSSAKKSCALDPMPTPLVVSCLDVLLPVITTIVNSSLLHGYFPSNWKEAIVTPTLKNPSLTSEFSNLRPISNSQFISKLTERAVFDQLQTHMLDHALYPLLQSAYRKSHSTETALIKVQNDILMNMDRQQVTLLVLLDLSAAFDTIDHQVLLDRFRLSFGISGCALQWISSYLSDRTQRVSFENNFSQRRYLSCGVPQGSCLGPLLFTMYASKLFDIIKGYLPQTHAYADDTQLYLSFKPDTTSSQSDAVYAMERCISAIRCWMIKDKLKVNDSKTEFILIGTRQQLAKVDIKGLVVGDATISPVTAVKNLGSWFDENMNMGCHINKMCKTLSFHLYNIRRIRKYLSKDSTRTLVHAFIVARIDYCNGLLYGLPAAHLNKLQRIQNCAARLVCSLPRFCHITPTLFSLHWLPVCFRIEFKLLILTFKAIHGLAPQYITDLITIKQQFGHMMLRSQSELQLLPPGTITKRTLGDRSFMASAPKLWNRLPSNIRTVNDLNCFKTLLKTHLFRQAFSCLLL